MKNTWISCSTTICILGLLACQDAVDSVLEADHLNRRAQTIFEGTWTWVKTEGAGIAGPYVSDSLMVGYSLHYKFGFSELQTYRDGKEENHYTYTFIASEIPEKQVLTLKDAAGNAQAFLWEVKDMKDEHYLLLRNVEPCCDNTFEQQFRLIAHPVIIGK